MIRGVAVSPGVVVAKAYCLDEVFVQLPTAKLTAADISLELSRFQQACDGAADELKDLIETVSHDIGEPESAIFQAQLVMLRDRAFVDKVKTYIVESQEDAASCLHRTMREYEELFSKIEDEYLRERLVDLRDVVARVQHQLSEGSPPELPETDGPVIIVAEELLPSQTVRFDDIDIAGIATERGGQTSHAAIIARSMGIPAVSGIPKIRDQVSNGDTIALDGRQGCLIVNPGPEAEAAYRKLEREFFDLKDYLIENRDQLAVTRDGVAIELLANINTVEDAQAATDVGAQGIGLFRTEYLFMTHPGIPTEEEQFEAYAKTVNASPLGRLTIRTLDLGGDKTVPYLGDHREANPFMGWRSIRMSIEHPDFFRKQVRAILRAAAEGEVRMMFPMISTVEELRRVNRMVWQVEEQLDKDGIAHGKAQLGMMIEVPAAAVCIEHFLDHTDFVSVGTNDLIQYLMAADRDNSRVAHLCDPLNPASLCLLRQVIEACQRRGKPVSVCGEMAGRPRCVLALLAFGLTSFSMSPAFVPIVKELVHSLDFSLIRELGDEILLRRSSTQVGSFLDKVLQEVNPRLAALDVQHGV
ncbi:Phosphoenolpyruvate-protein phosphotransferase [Planctomycetes bacterium Pan216]|uniref:Phosphoenolpyruvate-protein phosphotransferase n=1 Tax=Kolteria novifilia TaxID=2527975 RepID=A0A518AYI9_9BACT|nr:Phosphoenolpyruvate-protein phosphotransferase [Planctomycetes bacterium Pan216]